MALIEWKDELATGVAKFDGQHKQLIAMINELHDAMSAGKGKEAMGKILNGLINYTVTHFRDEEELMTKGGYPQLAAHKQEHKAFTDKALDLKKKYESGNMFITVEVMNFLRDWLTKHIKGTDKNYGPFLKSKGLA
jgi:hemerythrin